MRHDDGEEKRLKKDCFLIGMVRGEMVKMVKMFKGGSMTAQKDFWCVQLRAPFNVAVVWSLKLLKRKIRRNTYRLCEEEHYISFFEGLG